jgi:hypothetical protein
MYWISIVNKDPQQIRASEDGGAGCDPSSGVELSNYAIVADCETTKIAGGVNVHVHTVVHACSDAGHFLLMPRSTKFRIATEVEDSARCGISTYGNSAAN